MLALADLRRSADQQFNPAPAQITFKDSVRIVEIADDQIKTRKIGQQLGREFRVFREESRERPVFDRAHSLCVEAILREHGDMLVAEDLNVRVRIGVSLCLEGRQRENEIADRAAADHENAVHIAL